MQPGRQPEQENAVCACISISTYGSKGFWAQENVGQWFNICTYNKSSALKVQAELMVWRLFSSLRWVNSLWSFLSEEERNYQKVAFICHFLVDSSLYLSLQWVLFFFLFLFNCLYLYRIGFNFTDFRYRWGIFLTMDQRIQVCGHWALSTQAHAPHHAQSRPVKANVPPVYLQLTAPSPQFNQFQIQTSQLL